MPYRREEPPGAHAQLDHVEFYVTDAAARAAQYAHQHAFTVTGHGRRNRGSRSVTVTRHQITLVFTEGTADHHPASSYVQLHADGVATIALRVADPAAARRAAIAAGATPDGPGIAAFGDVIHTFVAGPRPRRQHPPGRLPGPPEHIDHIAICLESGHLPRALDFYRDVLGWQQTFTENIHIGPQAMQSAVVQSRSGGVTLTLLQPMPGAAPGQIDDFLKNHGGSGVQHLAFAVPDIVAAVQDRTRRGVSFLATPDTYYHELTRRMPAPRHPVTSLQPHGILADQDHDGQLFQIFTRSEHPRRTFFLELIERRGATTFGTSNIRKLYEAVEREQAIAAVPDRRHDL